MGKVILHYKGKNKLIPSNTCYNQLIYYAKTIFSLQSQLFTLYYVDNDGDNITITSDLDVQTMVKTVSRKKIKVYILDDEKTMSDISEQCQNCCSNQQDKHYKFHQKILSQRKNKNKEEDRLEIESVYKGTKNSRCQEKQREKYCQEEMKKNDGKEMKKVLNELIQQMVKLKVCQIVKEGVRKNKEKKKKDQTKTLQNNMKCSNCQKGPIFGARFQCLDCPNFNLCEDCEKSTSHKHSLLKVTESKEKKVKHDVKCSGCQKGPIFGARFQCLDCPNFNLCEDCEKSTSHKHSLLKVTESKEKKVKHDVKCSGCQKGPIFGARFQCLDCPNFNLCEDCEKSTSHKHSLLKVTESKEKKVKHDVKCSGCQKGPIFGARFQCLDCPNFNLCEDCEKSTSHNHSLLVSKHPFHLNLSFSTETCDSSLQQSDLEDQRSFITQKCFSLLQFFGGQPENYQQFISQNKGMTITQLCSLYAQTHQSANLTSDKYKVNKQKIIKLAFYFNQPSENFTQLVKKNPFLSFKKLINIYRRSNKKNSDKRKENLTPRQIQSTDQQQFQQSTTHIDQDISKKVIHQKRQRFLSMMCALLGSQNFIDHVQFFRQNCQLNEERIISKYLEQLSHD